MIRFVGLTLTVGALTSACTQNEKAPTDWPFSDTATTVLMPIAARVDRCLVSLRVPLDTVHAKAVESCACPATNQKLDCHVGSQFVAFSGPDLPTRASWRPSRSGVSEYGLAYVPDGLPSSGTTEFFLNGFATLDRSPTRLGPKWYLVSICGTCE